MPACSPQRYLANNRNIVRTATLTPSSVLPVANSVLELPVARAGTGQVLLTGDYSGAEEATIDVEVVDTTIDVPLVSAPIATGAGSGTLSNIASSGTAQTYTLQLQNAGIPELRAGIDFEGVRIVARADGAAGNGIEIEIDQSTLVFTEQNFSLLTDLNAGDGGETTGIKGAAFDFDTKVLSGDNIIPADAHRVSFGDDTGAVYLQYKEYVDGIWLYHFVPEIKRHIPKGTRISFVTGGRAVTVTPLVGSPETFSGIVAVYDMLNAFFTASALVSVDGVIAFDRSPTGQAAKELLIRTDAHCEPSTGTGSSAAVGFVDTFANANASTELVVARCTAVSSADHPQARVGATMWDLQASVSGALGTIIEGEPYTEPTGKFGLTIPQKVPDAYGVARGRFTHVDTIYMPRDDALKPPICPVALTLGTEAVDQSVELVWTRRPSGDCACKNMPVPRLDRRCLGLIDVGDNAMGYQADTVVKVVALYAYKKSITDFFQASVGYAAITGDMIPVIPPFVEHSQGVMDGLKMDTTYPEFPGNIDPNTGAVNNAFIPEIKTPRTDLHSVLLQLDGFVDVIDRYEQAIAEVDLVTDTTYRADGMDAWDDAFTELQADFPASGTAPMGIDATVYYSKLQWVIASAGLSPLGKGDADAIVSGDGCWRDWGGDFWTVVGSGKGAYANLFNNHPYHASRLSEDGKSYFSTKEFGLQVNIACPNLLVYGDKIILSINGAAWGSTYQVGDELVLPILAAQPLVLAGGQDGNLILDWYVSGSLDGPLANFIYDPDAPAPYSSGGLSFIYTPGGIPNQAGDSFRFMVEGGHWQYRVNGGAWILNSPSDDIDDAVVSFIDGLSIQWQTGAAPSFAVGDRYSFRVFQPNAVSNLQTPDRFMWRWSGATPSVVIDCGSSQPISALALYRHTIPAGATITVEGGDAPGVYLWSEPLTWQTGDIFKEVDRSARYLRLSLTGATGGGLAWFWAGVPVTTGLSAGIEKRRVYKLEGAAKGLAQGGNYLGKAYSGAIKWTEAALSQTDIEEIVEFMDWAKSLGDEPFLLVPNNTYPNEVLAAIFALDDVDIPELSEYNRDAAFERRYSIELPFAGVWRQ